MQNRAYATRVCLQEARADSVASCEYEQECGAHNPNRSYKTLEYTI